MGRFPDELGERGEEAPWETAFAAVPESDWDSAHLCALCGCVVEDPLEECPVCAAELEVQDLDGHSDL